MALVVVLIALMARDLGGSRRAQVLAAITAAVSGYLGAGHLDTTTDPDLLAWAVILWLLVKLLAGDDRRLWLAVGVATGIGLENKDTLLFLGAGLAVGLVITRRWDVLRSRWPWAAVGIALLLWAPNLAWQAANGWPQLTMASQISGYADDNRAQVIPLLWLFTGPFLFPVSAAGLAWILLTRAAAAWRCIGIAGIVALVLVFATGGKAYYAIGTASICMAAGGVVLDRWLARGHVVLKSAGFVAAAVLSGALIVLLTLPILPLATYATTSLPATVPDTANQVGWPQFVATVEQVVATLPPDERSRAVILANDYSEASPLILLGSGLPPVYSGHNSYWSWGPPPDDRTVVIHVGDWRPTDYADYFTGATTSRRSTMVSGSRTANRARPSPCVPACASHGPSCGRPFERSADAAARPCLSGRLFDRDCSSTVRSARGSASRRSSGIRAPLSTDSPYVPCAIRASARTIAASSFSRPAATA